MKTRNSHAYAVLAAVSILVAGIFLLSAYATTLRLFHAPVATSPAAETTPTLGNDGTSDLVVYSSYEILEYGFPDQSDIYYQRLVDGEPDGEPFQVTTDSITDDKLNDTSGDFIVFTSYDAVDRSSGRIMLYRISTGDEWTLDSDVWPQEARIYGDVVVWRLGDLQISEIMLFRLEWLDTGVTAQSLAGPSPPATEVEIGDRFVVWTERDGDYDIGAYDLTTEEHLLITETPDIDERQPSTSGDWIVWQARDEDVEGKRIEAKNMATGEFRVIVDDGSWAQLPSIDGNFVSYDSNLKGNHDIYVYIIPTGETLAVTTDPLHQALSSLRGIGPFNAQVAYIDFQPEFNHDIWVTSLELMSLYGVNSWNDGLSMVDPVSGVSSFIGPLDPDPNMLVTPVAMAVRPTDGTVFVWNNSDEEPTGEKRDTGVLLTVDRCTGLAIPVDPATPPQGPLQALAFASDGRLYGVDTELFSIDPTTGVKTVVGPLDSNLRLAGADFAPNGVLYGLEIYSFTSGDAPRLVTINTDTGQATVVAELSQDIGTVGSIVFDPSGTIIGSAAGTGHILFDVDPLTGGVSDVRPVSGGGGKPQGMGFASGCSLEVSPNTVVFGDVELGSSVTAIVTITNVSGSELSVDDISLARWGADGYVISAVPVLPLRMPLGGNVDVEITFAPSVVGPAVDVLQINSDVGLTRVSLRGEGVWDGLPPDEQIVAILEFFDESVDNGKLTGEGAGNSASGRMNALRNMIEAAGDLIAAGLIDEACRQLHDALKRTDGQPRPPDFVTGPAASELADQIQALSDTLGCG